MMDMCKQRKAFIGRFRESIELRAHHVFNNLMKTRNFEVAILRLVVKFKLSPSNV